MRTVQMAWRRRNPAPAAINLLWDGDSITNGNGDAQAIAEGGWRESVGDYFNTSPHGSAIQTVGPNNNAFSNGQGFHNGIVGSTIVEHTLGTGFVGQSTATYISTYNVDMVCTMLGTNNAIQLQPTADTRDEMIAYLASLYAAKPSIRVLVAKIIANGDPTWESLIVAYNATLDAVVASAAAGGMHVRIWDAYTTVGPYSPVTYDDLTHLKALGYDPTEPQLSLEINNFLLNW